MPLLGSDRALLVWMTRLWPSLLGMARVVEPATILRWHRAGFLTEYTRYYNQTRTHLSLDKDAPVGRAIQRQGAIVTVPSYQVCSYAADKWNDLRVVIGFEGDKPVMLGKWRATTEPGRYFTEHPVNPAGTARIEFGQYQAWPVGMHRGDHEALVQRGKVGLPRPQQGYDPHRRCARQRRQLRYQSQGKKVVKGLWTGASWNALLHHPIRV